MTSRFGLLMCLVVFISCSHDESNYFVSSKKYWFRPDIYIIGEVVSDSIRLQKVVDDHWACGCFGARASETLPLREGEGNRFKITGVKNGSIHVISKDSYDHEFTLEPGRDHLYHKVRNEALKIELEAQYEDSVRRILQTEITHHIFLGKYLMFPYKLPEVKKMMRSLNSQAFAVEYTKYLDQKLWEAREEAAARKENYESLMAGKIRVDSTYYQKFAKDYNHGYYDRRSLYFLLTQHPQLFYTANPTEFEHEVCYCNECFTKEEVQEMYCKVKPFERLSRTRNALWLFEHRGDLHCDSIPPLANARNSILGSKNGSENRR